MSTGCWGTAIVKENYKQGCWVCQAKSRRLVLSHGSKWLGEVGQVEVMFDDKNLKHWKSSRRIVDIS